MDPTAGTRLKSLRLCRAYALAFVLCTGCATPPSPSDTFARRFLTTPHYSFVRPLAYVGSILTRRRLYCSIKLFWSTCLGCTFVFSTRRLPNGHKNYARDVMPQIAAYARKHRIADGFQARSEERRVGKECRS